MYTLRKIIVVFAVFVALSLVFDYTIPFYQIEIFPNLIISFRIVFRIFVINEAILFFLLFASYKRKFPAVENLIIMVFDIYLFGQLLKMASDNVWPAAILFGAYLMILMLALGAMIVAKISADEILAERLLYNDNSKERILLLLMIPLIIAFGANNYYEYLAKGNLTLLKDNPIIDKSDRKELAEAYKTTIASFVPDKYVTLTLDERVDVLQEVEFIEARVTGRPANKVVVETLPENTYGKYMAGKNLIILNKSLVMSDQAEIVLVTLLHEAQHSNQTYLVKALDYNDENVWDLNFFKDIVVLRDNLRNYIEYSEAADNYEAYRSQISEIYAGYYALVALNDYSEAVDGITDYFKKNK